MKLTTFSSDVVSNEKYGGSQPGSFDVRIKVTNFETLKMNVDLVECTKDKSMS